MSVVDTSVGVLAPLPPMLPIAQVFDELAARAESGDRRAACRLAADLSRCAWASRHEKVWGKLDEAMRRAARDMQNAAVGAERGASQPEAGLRAAMQAKADEASTLCEGLSSEQREQAFKFQMRAAELGHQGAAVDLAVNPALDPAEFRRHIDEWQRYRDEAPRHLEAALARGDARAALTLATWYSEPNDRMPVRVGEGPVVPDPARAALYFELVERTAEAHLQQWLDMHRQDPRKDMSAAQRHAVAERAKTLLGAFKDKPKLDASPYHVDNRLLSAEDCE